MGTLEATEGELMTEREATCAHEACTCFATEGEYCDDYCRKHAGQGESPCACGHPECAGTIVSEAI